MTSMRWDVSLKQYTLRPRGEDIVGMIAVGQVIINRVNDIRFDDTICSVVHAGYYYENYPIRNRCQFSYWCDGKHERYGDIKAFEKGDGCHTGYP